MKQFYSVLTAMAVCFTTAVSAQFTETFESALSSGWIANNVINTKLTPPIKGINGESVSFSNNTTTLTSSLATPFIDFNTGSFTISFNYRLSNNLKSGKSRTFQIGYQDKTGTFFSLTSSIAVTTTTTTTYSSILFSIPNGPFRIVIRGTADGDNECLVLDDLSINANVHYSNAPYANSAPTANNDNFGSLTLITVSGNVLSNDTDPDAETLNATLIAAPTAPGTFVLNPDGSFSFTPGATFTGGPVTFTYKAIDNGFSPMQSNTATVTINYPAGASTPLPVSFASFEAKQVNSGVALTWNVGTELNVKAYEVERSADGRSFSTIGSTPATGQKAYSFIDAKPLATGYYRIKSVDVDGKLGYSSVVSLKGNASAVVLKAFPSPVRNELTVQHGTATNATKIDIASIDGRLVQSIIPVAGSQQTTINLSSAKAGLYLVRFQSGNGAVETLKVVKQ